MRKTIIALSLILLLFGCKKKEAEQNSLTVKEIVSEPATREFIIAGIPEEPNRWTDANGDLKGLDIDIIIYIMDKIDIPYKIILESSSARLEANWMSDNPQYDLVFTYSKKAEREEYLIYAKESHIDFSWNFFVRKEDEDKYNFETYEDLRGINIGATQGIAYSDEFWKAHVDGVLSLEIITKNEIQIEKLLAKRIDMVPLNAQATLYELKNKGMLDQVSYLKKPIKSKAYYNTFVKKSTYPGMNEIIEKYDQILLEMKNDGALVEILASYGL